MTLEVRNLDELRSVEELAGYEKEVAGRITELNTEYAGLPFPDAERAEFASLTETRKQILARSAELTARESYVRAMSDAGRVDRGSDEWIDRAAPAPTPRERDIFDLSTVRATWWDSDAADREIHERAMRAVELARFPHVSDLGMTQVDARAKVLDLLDSLDEPGPLERRILATGSVVYQRAFTKSISAAMTGRFPALSGEEQRAMAQADRALSLTGAAGGFAVPITIDPTIIPTSNGSVNPLRAISRVERIVGDEWRGVSSGAVTVAYAAEATETTDNSPTLAQPTISTEKAQAFIPFSIEIGQDWANIQGDLARLLQEGKDDLEADKFFTGTGTNEPFGVITGATNTVNATTGQTFDAEDLYRLEAALPPRYRARAAMVGNRAIFNLIRQFVLTGQSNPWKDLEGPTTTDGRVGTLLGYPAYEATGMTGTTATGVKFLLLGDFSRFVIVDRVGLDVEVIQHIVGTNHRPTGQRGLYAYFRNSSKVVDANGFRVLIGVA